MLDGKVTLRYIGTGGSVTFIQDDQRFILGPGQDAQVEPGIALEMVRDNPLAISIVRPEDVPVVMQAEEPERPEPVVTPTPITAVEAESTTLHVVPDEPGPLEPVELDQVEEAVVPAAPEPPKRSGKSGTISVTDLTKGGNKSKESST